MDESCITLGYEAMLCSHLTLRRLRLAFAKLALLHLMSELHVVTLECTFFYSATVLTSRHAFVYVAQNLRNCSFLLLRQTFSGMTNLFHDQVRCGKLRLT